MDFCSASAVSADAAAQLMSNASHRTAARSLTIRFTLLPPIFPDTPVCEIIIAQIEPKCVFITVPLLGTLPYIFCSGNFASKVLYFTRI